MRIIFTLQLNINLVKIIFLVSRECEGLRCTRSIPQGSKFKFDDRWTDICVSQISLYQGRNAGSFDLLLIFWCNLLSVRVTILFFLFLGLDKPKPVLEKEKLLKP